MRGERVNSRRDDSPKPQPKGKAQLIRTLKDMVKIYSPAVRPIVTTNQDGDEGIGSAFHVGEGTFVTARHVVEGMQSASLLPSDAPWVGSPPIPIQPLFHEDPKIDVAVFCVPQLSHLPAIVLGGHLDDRINDDAFLLNEVVVLGYPPIPLARGPVLIAAKGAISAVVDLRQIDHVHFVLTAMARGGFSGGVVLSEWKFALGVVTMSLIRDDAPAELGYLTVLSVEPIYNCLGQNGLLTKAHTELFGDLFDKRPPRS